MRCIKITYAETTPESAEKGDYSDHGWVDEEGVSMEPDRWDRRNGITAVHKAIEFLWDNGATDNTGAEWYTTGWFTTDYRTGTDREENYHLYGFSNREKRKIEWGLKAKKAERTKRLRRAS